MPDTEHCIQQHHRHGEYDPTVPSGPMQFAARSISAPVRDIDTRARTRPSRHRCFALPELSRCSAGSTEFRLDY